jgi:hypothetical protein
VSHIRTKPSTDTYRENYDRIFPPKRKAELDAAYRKAVEAGAIHNFVIPLD